MNTQKASANSRAGEFLRIRHLRLLQLIDAGGSLSHASRELHLSQPAVTKMLHELEDVFGPALVERGARGGRLTPRGRATLARLSLALANFDTALQEMGEVVPTLRVGVLPVAAMSLLAPARRRLEERQIRMRLVLFENTVGELLDELLRGRIDCVIGRVESEWLSRNAGGQVECTPLATEEMAVAAAPDHPLLQGGKTVKLAELVGQRWALGHAESFARTTFDAAFIQAGLLPPTPEVESQSFHTNVRLAADSDLLTFAPASAIDAYAELGMVRRVPTRRAFPSGVLTFVNLKASAELPVLRAFRESLAGKLSN